MDSNILTVIPLTGNYKELMEINATSKHVWILTIEDKVIKLDSSLFKNMDWEYKREAKAILDDYFSSDAFERYKQQKTAYNTLDNNVKTIVKKFLS